LCDHDRPRWRAYAARVRSKRPLQVISETSLCAHHRLLLVGRAVFHILFGAAVFRRSSWHITRVRPRARPHLPRGLRFALVLRGCRLCVTMPRGGNSSGEEVRDGSHDSNRGRDNRGDISPTALRLLRVGAGRAGPYTSPQGRAPPYSPFRGAALRLRGPLGGETIIVPGRLAHSNSILELPCRYHRLSLAGRAASFPRPRARPFTLPRSNALSAPPCRSALALRAPKPGQKQGKR
jgi:hypothetical protein